ncbi:hypothetical protein evm_012766 [Chilo suppressalis]|nr:hypothetical protein evm_012766 [Chilo suppressalis]
MSSKKGKRNLGNKHFPIAESVSIALKIQLDKFLSDENETELKFPTFLSAQERGFIHETVAKLGLKSKSRGKGVNRYITIYKRSGSTIIQNDAKLILDSNMRCTIAELFNAFPITSKEKDDLSCCPEKERSPQLAHKTLGQLNNGVAQVPNTIYNPDLIKFREKLPVYEQRQELLNAITHNQVIIVAGATGCGKTTQLPQLVLEHCQEQRVPARVYCTQPRRISAVSVAERVAFERQEKIGQSVGYQIRLESRVSPRTVLTYCTNGVLLRTLMAGDSSLTGVSHIFVDEVHERDKFSDFLLIALRDALPRFKELKLILMSATCDTQIFSRYFNNCPVVTIPGRLHEVQRFYLEDILRITQYKTKKMMQVEKELKAKLKSGGGSYWSHLEAQKSNATESVASNGGKDKEVDKENTMEPAMQADMDEFLDDCFKEGSLDSFCQILYMYLSEGAPVDAAHSRTKRTGLMAATRHGLSDTAANILHIGADPLVKDAEGKTAYDYAIEYGHTECAQLLATFRPAAPPALDDDEFLLDVYNHSVPEELVDHQLMHHLVKHIHLTMPKGAILVFMPGYDDIVALRDLVQADSEMAAAKFQTFTLHSNMQTLDQKKVFNPLPNARKVIIATNIAETSITIDDVVYVVDSCKVKEKYYESSGGVCSLQRVWAARSGLAQRAGRAGRCRPGRAYHMCSRRRARALPAQPLPEMLRVPLQELCLHTKLLAPGNTPIADFLARALEPPSFLAVRNAVALLKTIGALTPTEDLTEIGQHLLDLTVEPKLGKMLLYACAMKCLDPILTIVCCLASKEPFTMATSPDSRRRGAAAKRDFAADSFSDHMALLRAFQAWQAARAAGIHAERAFCARHLICAATMEMVGGHRAQLLAQLRALGLVKARGHGDIKDVNLNSERWYVAKGVLVGGLYPALARVDRAAGGGGAGREGGALRTAREARVALHPASTLRARTLPAAADWVAFEEMSRAGRFCFVRCCTLVTALTVALFAGPLRLPAAALTQRANPPGLSSDSDSDTGDTAPDAATLTLDDWIAFTADASDAIAVYYLRQKLSALILRRMTNPAKPTTPLDEQILAAVVHVLGAEERNAGLGQPPGVGQRPKPLAMDRMRMDDDKHAGDFAAAFGFRRPGVGVSGSGVSGPGVAGTWRSPAASPDAPPDARYFIVRADDPHSVDAAHSTGVYPFAPNTAKKLQKAKQEGARVVVFFSCASASKLLGSAALTDTGLDWISTQHVPFHLIRHVCNSLAGGARVVGARDGTEVCAGAARGLLAPPAPPAPTAPSSARDDGPPRGTRHQAPAPTPTHT